MTIHDLMLAAALTAFVFLLGCRFGLASAIRTVERRRGELPGVEPEWYPPTPEVQEELRARIHKFREQHTSRREEGRS